MVTMGLMVRLVAKPGKEAEVEGLLNGALPAVQAEVGTTAWFAVRFGPREFGIVDVFQNEAGRSAHLQGPVAAALRDRAELFAEPPRIQKIDVLADKLPQGTVGHVSKGVFLHFKPKANREQSVADFLREARSLVAQEPGTTAWFAVRLENGEYGIFDVFPDARSRRAHLVGRVPRELTKHAFQLLGSVPRLRMLNVTAEKLG